MEIQKLNTTPIYILMILGFLFCCLGGFGSIPTGIAFLLAEKQLKKASEQPEQYTNIKGMRKAKRVALIVLIINLLCLICVIVFLLNMDKVLDSVVDEVQSELRNFRH
jgi:hypothetical protein